MNSLLIYEKPASEQAPKQQIECLFQVEVLELDGI